MTVVDLAIAAGGCAVLFIVFVVLRPAKTCSGDCESCVTGACPSEGGKP